MPATRVLSKRRHPQSDGTISLEPRRGPARESRPRTLDGDTTRETSRPDLASAEERCHGASRPSDPEADPMILGLVLSLASALGTNLGALFKQRGATLAPPIRVRHPLRSAGELFGSKWFAIGWVVSLAAWMLHVGALSVAPLSTVQAVLSGGLVFLAVLAERWFGFHLGPRQWVGLTITAAGLMLIVTARVLAFCLIIAGAALMPAPLRATRRPRRAASHPIS
jgi:drug/metabolite transporter (DMT)-like permease